MLNGSLPPAAANAAAWLEHIRQYATVPEAEPAPGVFRLHVSAAPPPSLPQLLVKAGYRLLALEAERELLDKWAPLLPQQFAWQGIDGTRIAVCVGALPSEGGLQALLPQEEDLLLSSLPLYVGELPAKGGDLPVLHSAAEYRLNSARLTADFLETVRPHSVGELDLEITDAAERSRRAITEFAAAIDTSGLKRPVIVISNMSHFANEVISIPLKPGEAPVTAVGPEGETQPVQVVEHGNTVTALFVPRNVPLHGYAVWDIGATLIPAEPEDSVTAGRNFLENSTLKVEFDTRSGLITRITDQESGRDLLGETSRVHRNGKRELIPGACGASVSMLSGLDLLASDAATIEVVEHGPVRGGVRFTRTLPDKRSALKTAFRLTAGSTRLDIGVELQWHGSKADEICLRFPLCLNTPSITRATAFGSSVRTVKAWQPEHATQYEQDSCLWIDASEGDYGAALISPVPARIDADVNGLSITIPVPAAQDDQLPAVVRAQFSLLIHDGGPQDGEVVENSIALSRPLLHAQVPPVLGDGLPLLESYFEVDNASVFIHSIECVRSSRGALQEVFVRLYEAYNTRGEVLLSCRLPVKQAHLCDVLGNEIVPVPVENGEALLPVLPFEMITVRYTM